MTNALRNTASRSHACGVTGMIRGRRALGRRERESHFPPVSGDRSPRTLVAPTQFGKKT